MGIIKLYVVDHMIIRTIIIIIVHSRMIIVFSVGLVHDLAPAGTKVLNGPRCTNSFFYEIYLIFCILFPMISYQ